MDFGGFKLALMIVIIAGALAIIGLDIAILAEAVVTSVPQVAWASLAASVLVLAATTVIIAVSGYRFEEDRICVLLGFFKDKLPYQEITLLKQDADSGIYYIIVGDLEKGTNVRVDVAPAKRDAFVDELRKHIPAIPVETFVVPKRKDKND